jgi:hypothetical protein
MGGITLTGPNYTFRDKKDEKSLECFCMGIDVDVSLQVEEYLIKNNLKLSYSDTMSILGTNSGHYEKKNFYTFEKKAYERTLNKEIKIIQSSPKKLNLLPSPFK